MATQSVSAQTAAAEHLSWRTSIGFWMAVVLVVYILFNAVRAVADPVGFASNFGTPLTDAGDTGFVFAYAIRALFLGLFGLSLLIRRDLTTLMWYALIAAVMPLGDALLVGSAGGPTAAVVRHVATIAFLLATAFFLWRRVRA